MVSSKIAEVDIPIGVGRNDLDIDLSSLHKKQKVGLKTLLKNPPLGSSQGVTSCSVILSDLIKSVAPLTNQPQKREKKKRNVFPCPSSAKISLSLERKRKRKKEYPPHYNLDNVYRYPLLPPTRSCRPRRCPPGHREILHNLADFSSGNRHRAEEEASWCV